MIFWKNKEREKRYLQKNNEKEYMQNHYRNLSEEGKEKQSEYGRK